MKRCRKCGKTKAFTDFTKNKRERDGYRRVCRLCSSAYEQERYEKNSSVRVVQAAGQESRRHRNRVFLHNYLLEHPCMDCGETDPVVLECDHVRDKHYNISMLVAAAFSLETIQKELDKCEIRCANCHRRKTSSQFDWYDKGDPARSESHKQRKKLRSVRKNMVLGIRGSDVKSSKLKEGQVVEIKSLLKSGKTATEIANLFGMSPKSIGNIKNGKTWKHVQ